MKNEREICYLHLSRINSVVIKISGYVSFTQKVCVPDKLTHYNNENCFQIDTSSRTEWHVVTSNNESKVRQDVRLVGLGRRSTRTSI